MNDANQTPTGFPPYFRTQFYPLEPPAQPREWPRKRPTLNIILFLLTIISTYITGGLWYSLAIISILLAHEMGHYLMCRKYGVPATLPFFIPFPFANPFGTMGAVIQMKGIIPNRKALFDIGAAGPIAGLAITLPVIYLGLRLSEVVLAAEFAGDGITLGESLLFKGMAYLAKGRLAENQDIVLHPLAYAGWAGLFVTAMNLLPIGQLDGGHVMYSLFGQRSKYVTYAFLAALGILAIVYTGWALLFALLFFFGRRHPALWDEDTPVDRNRRLLGYVVFIIFVVAFTPMPFII